MKLTIRHLFLLALVLLSTPTLAQAATCTTDRDCSDGLFCDGVERCRPTDAGADARGCVRAISPCRSDQRCDEGANRCVTICWDRDGDGHQDVACGGDDCDDADASRYPGNVELCDDRGHDEDCNPATVGNKDTDGDGFIDDKCKNYR